MDSVDGVLSLLGCGVVLKPTRAAFESVGVGTLHNRDSGKAQLFLGKSFLNDPPQ